MVGLIGFLPDNSGMTVQMPPGYEIKEGSEVVDWPRVHQWLLHA